MRKLYEEADIQAVANAIRSKNRSQEKYRVSAMPDAIRGISTSYHHEADRPEIYLCEQERWSRPAGWPDLDSLALPDDGTNCIYLTVDNTNPRQNASYVRFYHTGNCECYVDYGHVDGDRYVVDSTDSGKGTWNSPVHLFTVNDVAHPVIRLRSGGATTFRETGIPAITAANSPNGRAIAATNCDMAPILEVVGIVPTITSFTGTNANPVYGGRFCRRIYLKECDRVNSMAYAFQYNTLCRSLVLSTKYGKMHIGGSMVSAFNTCQSLTDLDLSMIEVDDVTHLGNLFDYCRFLRHLNLSGWNVTSKCTNLTCMFRSCKMLCFGNISLGSWDVSKVTSMSNMFDNCYALTQIDLSAWNPASVTTMAGMFTYCRCLEMVKMPLHTAPKLTDINAIFSNCTNLSGEVDMSGLNPDCLLNIANAFTTCIHIEKVNMGNMKVVTNTTATSSGASSVFNTCYSLKEIIWDMSRCDFTKGASVNSFYANCYNLESPIDWSFFHGVELATTFTPWTNCYKVPSITLSDEIVFPKLNTLSSMFSGCQSLKRIDISMMRFSVPIIKMDNMFLNCRNAEEIVLPTIDTSEVTTLASMFSNCYRLKKLPATMQSLDLPKCTTLSSLFYETLSLEDIDLSAWRNVKPTSIGSLFASCANLRRINLAGWDTSAITGTHSSMFSGAVYESLDQTGWSVSNTGLVPDCPILEDWYPPVFNIACNISKLYSLSDASLERLVRALPKRTTATTITIGAPLIKRLSLEQIATITGKGWTIA